MKLHFKYLQDINMEVVNQLQPRFCLFDSLSFYNGEHFLSVNLLVMIISTALAHFKILEQNDFSNRSIIFLFLVEYIY